MMSAENPYAAASAHGGGAQAGLDFVRQLREAANQQQQLQAQGQQKAFNDELELRKQGYVPYYQNSGPADPSQPNGLKTRTPVQGASPSDTVTTPDGRKWVKAPPQLTPEQQATQQHQGNGDLLTALKDGARPVSPQGTVQQYGDIPVQRMDESGNLSNTGRSGVNLPVSDQPGTAMSIGGQKLYMPTEAEKSEDDLRKKTTQASAMQDAEGWVLPDSLARAAAKHAGLPDDALVGVKLPHETVAEAFKAGTTPDKPERPDATQIIPGYQDASGSPLVFDRTKGTATPVKMPPGAKQVLTPEQRERAGEVADRRKAAADQRQQIEDDRQQKVIEELGGKREKINTERAKLSQHMQDLISESRKKDGELVTIRDFESGKTAQKPMSKAVRLQIAGRYQDVKASWDALGKQSDTFSKQIEQRQAKRKPAADQPAPAAAAAPTPRVQVNGGGAQPLDQGRPVGHATGDMEMIDGKLHRWDGTKFVPNDQYSPAGKTATMDHVRAYAKQKGIGEAAAVREFKSSGFTIGQ